MQMTPVTPPDERKAAKTGWLVGRAGFKCIAPNYYSFKEKDEIPVLPTATALLPAG